MTCRARRPSCCPCLWAATAAILNAGILAQALAAPAGTAADMMVAASALLLAVSATLLIRVLLYLTRPSPLPITRP